MWYDDWHDMDSVWYLYMTSRPNIIMKILTGAWTYYFLNCVIWTPHRLGNAAKFRTVHLTIHTTTPQGTSSSNGYIKKKHSTFFLLQVFKKTIFVKALVEVLSSKLLPRAFVLISESRVCIVLCCQLTYLINFVNKLYENHNQVILYNCNVYN